jgi:hypothetical protein
MLSSTSESKVPISELSEHVEDILDRFAWEEWSQMGLLATSGPARRWAQDPEALLLFTFEVGRGDPRLFDEVLDWLVTNEQLVNLRRLRSLAVDPEDRALCEAVIAWLGHQRPKARFAAPTRPERRTDPEPLFFQENFPVAHADETFATHGWLRPAFDGSRKSMPPAVTAPINLSFRLRLLFGLTARAELARLLLTTRDQGVTSTTLARGAGYTKRNVHEALAALETARVVRAFATGHEFRYRIDHERWEAFLEIPEAIEHVDWIPILLSMRRTLRWLRETSRTHTSTYLTSSSARDLLDQIRPDLESAGVPIPAGHRADTAVDDLLASINQVTALLDSA